MSMSRSVKWGLVFAILLSATLFAYIRISDAIDDYQNQIIMQEAPSLDLSPPPCDHPSCREKLSRT
jgi:hypothetical protein